MKNMKYNYKLRLLLQHDNQELKRRITQLEIIGKLRDVQQIIIEEEKNMAITYNIKEDIRYQLGAAERDAVLVKNLLSNTSHSISEIAQLTEVSEESEERV